MWLRYIGQYGPFGIVLFLSKFQTLIECIESIQMPESLV